MSGKKILVFAGSSSRQSINKQLAIYAASLLKKNPFTVVDLNDYPLPLFSVDLEADGYPEPAVRFYGLIEEHDGVILSLAEHNGSYSAVFKNLLDWLSRIEGKFFRGKPLLLMSTSTGAGAAARVMEAALSRFPRHDGNIIAHFSLPSFDENFSKQIQQVTHTGMRSDLEKAVGLFEDAFTSHS